MDPNNRDEGLQCRICAEQISDKKNRIYIFDEDARRNYLQTKIRKYLYILVSLEDRLPKMVCSSCIKTLEGIHRFATMAHRIQKRLQAQFDAKEENEEDSGLLRSILIAKDGEEEDTSPPSPSSSVLSVSPDDLETEEMEVKVDPSIFLQYSLDRSISPELSDLNSDSEENHSKNVLSEILDGRNFDKNNPKSLNNEDEPEKTFDCSLCPKSYETQLNLQNHLWSHLPKAEHFCNDHKQTDIQRFSNDSGDCYVCPICNKKISTKGNLKVHLETHRPKGKYGCDICGRIFKTQSNLFRHKEYHGGIQFPCSVCGRVYPTNSTLRAHSITHSSHRPHACPFCDKTFKRNQDLKFHLNWHTGARPYQCPYCPKAFASSGNCFSHRKRMHPNEVNRDRLRAADLMK